MSVMSQAGEAHRLAGRPELGLELRPRSAVDVDEADLAALRGEGADNAFADARGAAGDDDRRTRPGWDRWRISRRAFGPPFLAVAAGYFTATPLDTASVAAIAAMLTMPRLVTEGARIWAG